MDIKLQAETLHITDKKLNAYLSRNGIIPEVWSELSKLLESAGAYDVDYIDWSTAPQNYINVTVDLGSCDKLKVLKVLREYIKNVVVLEDITEGQCFKVNHPDWDCGLKMLAKRIYKNGTVSLKSLSIGYKNVTVKLDNDNYDEYEITETPW